MHNAQQHLYMGVKVGISANYRAGSTPSSGKKSNLSLVMSTVCARRKYTSISFYRLCISFTLTVMCNLVWNSTCIGLLRHPVPSSEQWKGQMVGSLTSWCVVKIPALRRMSSCSPVAPVKDQSELCLSMSFTQDNNRTSFTDLVWSRRS